MIRRRGHAPHAAAVVALVLIAAPGCADDPESGPVAPDTRFAAALGTVGGGSGAGGIGWAEPALIEPGPSRTELIGDALGPNASSVVDAAPALERRFGFDPAGAEPLVSVGGSYAFGLRADGVDGSALARMLRADGARVAGGEGVELIAADDPASVPDPLGSAGVQGLGAFDAVGGDEVVLAISERARAALLGEGQPRIDLPIYAAAAECLGDVVAAKLTPDSNLVSTDLGIGLVAAGVRADGAEVVCTLGGEAELVDGIEANLRRLLTPEGSDPASGAPFGDSIAAVEVDRGSPFGIEVARATIEPAPTAEPGFVFGLVSGAGIVGLINGEGRTFEPFGAEEGSEPGDG